jgi:hypothetical protein
MFTLEFVRWRARHREEDGVLLVQTTVAAMCTASFILPSQKTAIISLNSVKRLMFLIETMFSVRWD